MTTFSVAATSGAIQGLRAGLRQDLEARKGVGGRLGGRIAHTLGFATSQPQKADPAPAGAEEVSALKRKLQRSKVLETPKVITAEGAFLPCVLLSAGWWERLAKDQVEGIRWRDPVQEWLFRGWEDWGPSWDISLLAGGESDPCLFAQLGAGDEADSLLVAVPGEKAKLARNYLLQKGTGAEAVLSQGLTFQARVTGVLCHRSHLPESLRTRLGRWGRAFDYCIRLEEDQRQHGVSIVPRAVPDQYSGYLWQCLAPRAWIAEKVTPELNDVYFIWEHTDFAKPDAVKYNLDSLQRKASYLQSLHGDLVLLQKSSPLVPGDCAYPAQEFYDFVLRGGALLHGGAADKAGGS